MLWPRQLACFDGHRKFPDEGGRKLPGKQGKEACPSSPPGLLFVLLLLPHFLPSLCHKLCVTMPQTDFSVQFEWFSPLDLA